MRGYGIMTDLQEKAFEIIKLSMQYNDMSDEEIKEEIENESEEALKQFLSLIHI